MIALAVLFGLVVFLSPVPSPESGTNYFDGIDKDANAETQSDFHVNVVISLAIRLNRV